MNIQEAAAASTVGQGAAGGLPVVFSHGSQAPVLLAQLGEMAASQMRPLTPIS